MTSLRIALFTLLALLHVSVAQEPSLQVLPSSIMKALGDGVYVSCEAHVDDPELVTEMEWTGPNGNEIPSSDDNIKTMENYGGPGKLDLMIRNLREQDTGIYNCTATYAGNQKLTSGLLVESYMNIDFGDTPTHQTPFIGTESKIRCTPVAKPAPQVDWLKDLVPLKNDDNHIIQQDGVLIKEVTEADEGVYRCRARVPQLGSIDYKDIQVEVYIPPIINIVPEDAKGVEKDSVTFNCGATGKPVPVYSWVNKDNEPLEDKEGYYVDTEKGILTIMDLKPEHTGNYRCTATNPAGDDTANANLLVLTKPKVEQYLNITEPVDADAEMRCIATGDPLPEIVFKKESEAEDFLNGINLDDRIEVEQTTDDQGRRVGIMKIRGVMRRDDGLYTCTAKSEGGLTQVWGHITVEFKPTFEEQSRDEYWSWEQERVNLTCIATSIPNATIQWYFRNEEIKATDNNLKVVALGPVGVLEVNPSQSYYGTYTCQATNILGTEEYNLELKEAHVPGPVSNVQLEKKTATTITWGIIDPIDNGGLIIQGYLVQYRIRDVSWDLADEKFWTKGSSYTLDGLQPQETYVFRFSARNEAGNGEWGGEKVEEMPKRAEPEEPLIFNADSPVVEIPYKDHYVLQWKVPLDNGEPIDYFQIMYYQVHNSSGKWTSSGDKATEESKYPGTTSYTIENLHPETYYKIELRAHNMIGFSTPAEAIIKTAHDPSVKPGTGGPSKTYSSVAPSTSAPAHGTVMPQPSTGGIGTGLIIGIVIILALIIIVIVDVICYCTKNAGLTATIVGKRGPKAKDKEAMLEEGKNASDEKHEGNGQMKPTQEEETKPVVQQETPDEKVKETTEPTETTPMIQGEKDDKEAILKEEQKEEELKKSESKGSMTKDSPV